MTKAAPLLAGVCLIALLPFSLYGQQNISYGHVNGTDLLLDVYRPSEAGATPRPGIILIHGGGWTNLDKSTMERMGNFLARSGFVAFSVNYRLYGNGQNRWPAQLDDVQRAVRWVRANAKTYNVNPQQIGAFGHSAGAQLAALLGMEDTRDNSDPALASYSSKVQAVVDTSGPVDFVSERSRDGDQFLTKFLGASYEQNPEIWRDASPAFHVAKSNAPFLIVHGTQDQNVPIAESEEFCKKLQAAGVPVTLIKLDDGHTFQAPASRRKLATETVAFFDRTLVHSQ